MQKQNNLGAVPKGIPSLQFEDPERRVTRLMARTGQRHHQPTDLDGRQPATWTEPLHDITMTGYELPHWGPNRMTDPTFPKNDTSKTSAFSAKAKKTAPPSLLMIQEESGRGQQPGDRPTEQNRHTSTPTGVPEDDFETRRRIRNSLPTGTEATEGAVGGASATSIQREDSDSDLELTDKSKEENRRLSRFFHKVVSSAVQQSERQIMSAFAESMSEMMTAFQNNMTLIQNKICVLERGVIEQRNPLSQTDGYPLSRTDKQQLRQTDKHTLGQTEGSVPGRTDQRTAAEIEFSYLLQQDTPSLHRPSVNYRPQRRSNEPGPSSLGKPVDIHKWGVRFDGSSKSMSVESFFFRIETLQRKNGLTEEHLLANFHHLVTGAAERWYWEYMEENAEQASLTYLDLKLELIDQFKHSRRDHEILRTIMERRQQPHETFDDFYSDIRTLTLQMRIRPHEDDLVSILRQNLKE